jgi:inhibitor of KinA
MVYFADEVGEAAFQRGRAIAAAIERHPPAGLREYVLSFTSVLLEFLPDHDLDPAAAVEALQDAARVPVEAPAAPKSIRVRYDGPDLGRVAEYAGLNTREVVDLHASTTYRVYSLGFAPGFPYLGDLDPRLRAPRLPTPRLQVPAGSVAIGGEHTGIYPMASPGGWNLIGRTETRLFAPDAPDEAKFFLRAGDLVRFEPE